MRRVALLIVTLAVLGMVCARVATATGAASYGAPGDYAASLIRSSVLPVVGARLASVKVPAWAEAATTSASLMESSRRAGTPVSITPRAGNTWSGHFTTPLRI